MKRILACAATGLLLSGCVSMQRTRESAVELWPLELLETQALVRIVDVGAGMCVIGRVPGPHYFVYDAGNFENARCERAANLLIDDARIDMLVLSHGDADHIGNTPKVIGARGVDTIVWTGDERTTATWRRSRDAIASAAGQGTSIVSMRTWDDVPGQRFRLGDATLTLLAGWGESPWDDLDESDRNNVISVVVRLDYGDSSLLLTGDTVGRHRDDDNAAPVCERAEKVMVDRAAAFPLAADVLVAPHHGANNGSAGCFIGAVAPKFVVFSAGHKHAHPRALAVERYQAAGLDADAMFRNDRGDDEGGKEWADGAQCGDEFGDDDIEVRMPLAGDPTVQYVGEDACP